MFLFLFYCITVVADAPSFDKAFIFISPVTLTTPFLFSLVLYNTAGLINLFNEVQSSGFLPGFAVMKSTGCTGLVEPDRRRDWLLLECCLCIRFLKPHTETQKQLINAHQKRLSHIEAVTCEEWIIWRWSWMKYWPAFPSIRLFMLRLTRGTRSLINASCVWRDSKLTRWIKIPHAAIFTFNKHL